MDKNIIDKLRNEKQIPDEVLEKLIANRKNMSNKKIKQEKTIKIRSKYVVTTLLVAAAIILIVLTKNTIGTAIEEFWGSRKDSGVAAVDNTNIPTTLNLVSIQNGREIKLTKFVSTSKKFAFDYQFKVDENLKELLKKYIANNDTHQDIQLGLFANDSKEDLFGGVHSISTFKLEGDTFFGSVISTFDTNNIPENAKLKLHIYRLAWMDRDEYERAKSAALAGPDDPQPFSVKTALEYNGDWSYTIDYRPLNQTSNTKVISANNVTNIVAKNDALQTTVAFNAPVENHNAPEITVYKDGVEVENMYITFRQRDIGKFEIGLDLSALDKTSVYKVKIEETDLYGKIIKEVGYFEVQNK